MTGFSAAVLAIALSALAMSAGAPSLTPALWPGGREEVATSIQGFEWRTAPQLLIARADAVAVTLPSGDVLVTGGVTQNGPTATTEVFDSELSLWRLGPQMSVGRVGHTATVLGDGKVLVTGGDTGSGTTSTAELIDLGAGSAVPVPNMNFARSGHAAVLLKDGRVLVAGGTNWVTGVWNQAEVFDPVGMKWSPAGTMLSARLFFSMFVMGDGKVLAVGGDLAGTSELFDPTTMAWSMRANMTSPATNAAAAMLGDTVVAAGGMAGGYPSNRSETYDYAKNTWSAAGNMLEPRARFTLTPVPGGGLLAAGSYANGESKATCELFDPGRGAWTAAPAMNLSRGEHAAAALPSGAVLMMGGRSKGAITPSVEMFYERPAVPQRPCMPIDLVPLVRAATELPGNSSHGLIAKLLAAQAQYDDDNFTVCANLMDAFYNQVRAFASNGHMTRAHADAIYDGYASVMLCIGARPKPPLEGARWAGVAVGVAALRGILPIAVVSAVYPASDGRV